MPTFVLVHGGCHASWCWEDLTPHLNGRVVAPDLPGRSGNARDLRALLNADFVDAVVQEIERGDLRDVTLVGHSLARVIVPAVCTRIPDRISALALIAAAIPPPGGRVLDLLPAPMRALSRVLLNVPFLTPSLPRSFGRYMFCNDMTPEQTRRTLDRLTPEAVQLTVEPVPRTPLPASLPVTYVRFTKDQIITPTRAAVMIENLGRYVAKDPEVVDIDAGHDGIITQPEKVAALLNSLG